MIPLIDTHQHLWDLNKLSLSWIKRIELMNRSYLMSDYLKAASGTGIEKTVYMEVNVDPDSTDQEIEQMTEHCRSPKTPMQAMVIALDPMAESFQNDLKRQAANPFLRGVRSVLHIPQTGPGYCLQDDFISGIQEIGRNGLIFDICIRPVDLPDAVKLVRASPETTFVIDHCGNADPHVVNGDTDPGSEPGDNPFWHTAMSWKDDMSALAASPNTICKLSGIVARAQEGWSADTLAPTIDHCLDAFGSERVIFGGDWPVCLCGTQLSDWVGAFREVVAKRSSQAQRQVMHENAQQIYKI
jgi:L-fuconolactonase